MATSNQSSVLAHTDTTTFRAWAQQVSTQLRAVGLVATADTGQIDFTTVLYTATTHTAQGYEIYRFNDALQGQRPVFIKIEYGTAGNAGWPSMWITVGSGSNGAGTLTGVYINRRQFTKNTALSGVPTVSLASYVPTLGVLNFAGWLSGASASPFGYFYFSIARPVDDTGAPTDEGIIFYWNVLNSNTPAHTVYSFMSGSTVTDGGVTYTFIPSQTTSSVVGLDVQLFRHFCALPRIRHLPGSCTYFDAEISRGTSFPATLVGTTPRTYIALGNGYPNAALNGNISHVLAMLFE